MRAIAVTASMLGVAALLGSCAGMQTESGPAGMSFFITSAGPGKGADLGGLEGADRHCQALAKAAGAGAREWRAYLSTQAPKTSDPGFINARDRIGNGPWQNAKGVVIARNLEELHSQKANVTKDTALDEKGQAVNGRTEKPNRHDILTGLAPGRDGFSWCTERRYDLRQLDQRRQGRFGHGRPPRSRRSSQGRVGDVVELVARDARMRSGVARQHGRRRPVLLLRGEVRSAARRETQAAFMGRRSVLRLGDEPSRSRSDRLARVSCVAVVKRVETSE